MKNFLFVLFSLILVLSSQIVKESKTVKIKPQKDILSLINEELSKKETGSDLEFYKFTTNPNQVVMLNHFPIYFMEGELEEKQNKFFSFKQPTTKGSVIFISKKKWTQLPVSEKMLIVQSILNQIQRELAEIQLEKELYHSLNNKDIMI